MSRLAVLCAAGLTAATAATAAAVAADVSMAPNGDKLHTVSVAPARALSEEEKARMVLDRLAFGARPGQVDDVRKLGVDAWIRQQLYPERLSDQDAERRVAGLSVPKQTTEQLFSNYRTLNMMMRQAGLKKEQVPQERERLKRELTRESRAEGHGRPRDVYAELSTDRLLRATYSERQLQEVMVDFWSNHFNVYSKKQEMQWYLPAYDREVIRPRALGKFRELLLATARSPAMMLYLDNFQSVAPQPRVAALAPVAAAAPAKQKPRGINENYARELMELQTLGVDGGFTQQDVTEVARAFTGWTVVDPRGRAATAAGPVATARRRGKGRSGEFIFRSNLHDPGAKLVLGQRIEAGGEADGVAVIDLLANHPSTARFIARKLCEKFASDTPDPAMVARVASAFSRSDGDIRTTLSALFRDPAFFTSNNYRAKVKTPFELVVSALRALDAQSDGREVQLRLADMGQPLYGFQAPTGYGETAAGWVNAGALVKRMNFAVALTTNRIPGTRVELTALGPSDEARDQLATGLQNLLGGQVSPETERGLVARLNEPLAARGDSQRMQVAALILGSPEFQRQ